MKLIVDLSNLCWTFLRNGTDKENGKKVNVDGKVFQVNSAEWGYDSAVDYLVSVLAQTQLVPRDIIFVEETGSTLLFRRQIDPNYKLSREKKPEEAYHEFKNMIDALKTTFLPLGSQFVTQDGAEADDVIAYLARQLNGCIILSTDADMQACISDKANLLYKGKYNENRLGSFPIRFTTLYKSLVGDSSDNIKGAHNFGDKAFETVYAQFGDEGLSDLERLVQSGELEQLLEDVAQCKVLQRLVDDRENVYLSYQVASLYPDRVNTLRKPLVWQVGNPKDFDWVDNRLKVWESQQHLVTTKNFDKMLKAFRDGVKSSPFVALDIETTSPEESDLWLAEKKAKAHLLDGEEFATEKLGVDVLSQTLTGMALTFGDNGQYTIYLPHNHRDTPNLSKEQICEFLLSVPSSVPYVIHNVAFELSVLHRELGNLLEGNGWHGFIPNAHDTRILASYVDENKSQGLKEVTQRVTGYKQATYDEVTQGRKMHQLTANEVFDYGCDDTICCSILYNHFQTICEIEGTWDTFLQVEIEAAYMTAKAFNEGTCISMQTLLEQEKEDEAGRAKGWLTVRDYLIEKGWAGTVCPSYKNIDAAGIKEAYHILTGEPLKTMVRTPEKLLALIEAEPKAANVAFAFRDAIANDYCDNLNQLVKANFSGEPAFNFGSPKQKADLLYDAKGMGLPIHVHNKATDNMRAAGRYEGSPSTDDLALQYALKYDAPEGTKENAVIKAIQAINIAETRQKLYYTPYKFAVHWATGLVHAYLNQCAAVTRRYSASGPNVQQLPKHPKATGEPAKFREVYTPHKKGACIVSLDFDSQELRLIADYSRDPNMVGCYVGDELKDMHAMTGTGILMRRLKTNAIVQVLRDAGKPEVTSNSELLEKTRAFLGTWTAGVLKSHSDDKTSDWHRLAKTMRALGKKVNFTTEYGAMAPKLAKTMLVEENEAQQYIDAKLESFGVAAAWKQSIVDETRRTGTARSKMGGVRHLAEAILLGGWEAMAAERQGVNFKIQSSGCEMTKMAMGRIWRSGVLFDFDCKFLFPVHDELVFSVMIEDLFAFLSIVHPLMTAQFADMEIPVVSSISIGPNFGQQHEIGGTVDAQAIAEAVAKFKGK